MIEREYSTERSKSGNKQLVRSRKQKNPVVDQSKFRATHVNEPVI